MQTIKLLGHTFTLMTGFDYMGFFGVPPGQSSPSFAGAEPGSYICNVENYGTLIFDPKSGILDEMLLEDLDDCTGDVRRWKLTGGKYVVETTVKV